MSDWLIHDLFASIPECAGHVPLSVAFARFVAVECDLDPFDQVALAEELSSASCSQQVVRWFVRLLQAGDLKAVSRPLGGGEATLIPQLHWHADDASARFLTAQYCQAYPFNPAAEPDCWIFLEAECFERIWKQHRERVLGPHAKPSRRASAKVPTELMRQISPASAGLLMSLAEVETAVRLKRSTIYKMIEEQSFPGQLKVGGRALWKRVEIELWISGLSSVSE